MNPIVNMYLNKLKEAMMTNDSVKMATITYQAFRNSPYAQKCKGSKKEYKKLAIEAIFDMEDILKQYKWDEELISAFLEKIFELFNIKNPRDKKE